MVLPVIPEFNCLTSRINPRQSPLDYGIIILKAFAHAVYRVSDTVKVGNCICRKFFTEGIGLIDLKSPNITEHVVELDNQVPIHELFKIFRKKNLMCQLKSCIKVFRVDKFFVRSLHDKTSFFARVRTPLAYLFGNNYIILQIYIKCKFKKTVIK